MKKGIVLLAAILLCLGQLACNNAEAPSAGTTTSGDSISYLCNYSSLSSNGTTAQIYETDNTVYYLIESGAGEYMLCFSDKEYKDWMPLCSKPDCLHKGHDCNAVLEEGCNARILLYGDHFYYITEEQNAGSSVSLWRMKLDGSGHELVYTLQQPNNGKVFYELKMWGWTFFNKYADVGFVGCRSFDGDVDPELMESYHYLIDLSREPVTAEPFDGYFDESGTARSGIFLAGDGNIMYSYNADDNNAIYRFDIDARSAAKLCELPFDFNGRGCWLDGQKLYFCCGSDIACVNADNGSIEILSDSAPEAVEWLFPFNDYVFGESAEASVSEICVCDFGGTLKARIPFPADADIAISYAIGDCIFGYESGSENKLEDPPSWYLDIRDIGTDRLMWRRWEP